MPQLVSGISHCTAISGCAALQREHRVPPRYTLTGRKYRAESGTYVRILTNPVLGTGRILESIGSTV